MTCGGQPLPFNFIFMAFTSLSNWILHVVVWLEKYLLLAKRHWPLKNKAIVTKSYETKKFCAQYCFTALLRECFLLLRATRGARNPNIQVIITHAWHVCRQHSFGLPPRMNGMHRKKFDHVPLDPLSLLILSRVFWPSVTWNVRKAQCWSKSVFTFDRCRPHSVTFGYY